MAKPLLRRHRLDQILRQGLRMETFTLTVWLMMGSRFEEIRIENMSRGECVERLMTIDRARAKVQCAGASGSIMPDDRPLPAGDWPLPDRSPGAPPVICPIMPPCWQGGSPVRGA